MKYITLIIGLLVVGCGEVENGAYKHRPKQTDTNESTPTTNTNEVDGTTAKPVKELTLEEKVVGEYEMRNPNQGREGKDTIKLVLLGTGIIEMSAFVKTDGGTWKMVGNEVHVAEEGKSIAVFKIEPNGDLTMIAEIIRTKRKDIPKEEQTTIKKIK